MVLDEALQRNSEQAREKEALEEDSKKALAMAIQQLELEMTAKEMHEATIIRLNRARDDGTDKVREIASKLEEKEAAVMELEESRYRLQVKADSQEASAVITQQSLRHLEGQLEAKLETLGKAKHEVEREMMGIAKERDALKSKNNQLKEALAEAKRRFEDLEGETQEMQRKMGRTGESLAQAMRQLEQERDELQQQLQLAEVQREGVRTEKEEARRLAGQLQLDLNQLQHSTAITIAELQADIEDIRGSEQDSVAEVKREAHRSIALEARLVKLAGEHESAEGRIEELEQHLARFSQLENRLARIVAEKEKLQDAMEGAQSRAIKAESTFNSMKAEMQRQVLAKDTELAAAKEQHKALVVEMSRHKATIEATKKKSQAFHRLLESLATLLPIPQTMISVIMGSDLDQALEQIKALKGICKRELSIALASPPARPRATSTSRTPTINTTRGAPP